MMNRFMPPHRFVWISTILGVILAIILAVQSVDYRRPQDPLCGGVEGSGFPLTYLCSYESPTGPWPAGSWGKTEDGGFLLPNLYFWINVLIYSFLLLIPWLAGAEFIHRLRQGSPPDSYPDRFAVLLVLLLAAGLMVSTSGFQYDFGRGNLGAGLPLPFILDYSSGGSPLSSAGKIDSGDFPFFSLFGVLADLLFYFELLWIGWVIVRRTTYAARQHTIMP